jgi:hypothetical protein
MQEILEQVQTLKETDELFLMWEQELDLAPYYAETVRFISFLERR